MLNGCLTRRSAAALLLALLAVALAFAPALKILEANSPPAAPTNITTVRTADQIVVSWTAGSDATGYNVNVSQDSKQSWTRLATNQSATTYTHTGIDHTLVYVFSIQAVNSSGSSDWVNSAPVHPVDIIPGPPSAITANRTVGQIAVSWTPPENAGQAKSIGYDVNYSTDHKNSWTRHATEQSAASATITTDNSMTWYVSVRAVTAGGRSGWVTSGPIEANFLVLPAPATVSIGSRTLTSLAVSWSAVDNAQSYNVNLSANDGYSWSRVKSAATGTSFTVNSADWSSFNSDATYIASVQAVDNGVGGDWKNSAPSGPIFPPGPPASVSGTRSLNAISVSWTPPADDGNSAITHYDVNMSVNGGASWTREASDVTGASTTVSNVNNATDYIFAVRAKNNAGYGGWTNSAVIPGLDAPASITAYRGSNFIDVEWSTVTGAVSYQVNYSADGGATWTTPFSSVSAATPEVRIPNVPNVSGHLVAVRGRNANGPGAWANSASIDFADFPLPVTNLTATRVTSGEIDVSWNTCDLTAVSCTGGSPVTGYAVNISSNGGVTWTRAKDVAVTGFTSGDTVTLTGVDDNTAYLVSVSMRNRVGGKWVNASAGKYPTLSASGVTRTGATLNFVNYDGAWWYQRTQGPSDTTCHSVTAGTTTATLSNLTASTFYGYTVYSDSACATALRTVHFSTTDYSVGNLYEATSILNCAVGYPLSTNNKCAVAFTTGSETGGYRLRSITGRFANKGTGDTDAISVAIHAKDTSNNSNPASTSLVALSGSDPNTAGLYTYTCSGAACDLSANETYFVVMSTADTSASNNYNWEVTTSDAETARPSTNGWSIANVGRVKEGNNAWADLALSHTAILHVAADVAPALTVSGIKETTATLNLANYTGSWYYKEASGSCSGAQSGTTATLTDLTPATSYTYSAYSDASCTTLIDAAPAFTTGGQAVSISTVTATSDGYAIVRGTILASGPFTTGANTGGYTMSSIILNMAAAAGSPGTLAVTLRADSGGNPSSTSPVPLTLQAGSDPLTAGQATYTCASNCDLDANTKYHIVLAASSGSTNNEYRWRSAGSPTATLSPTGNGWSYSPGLNYFGSWQSIGGNTLMKVNATANIGLTASNITGTTARLTLSQHGGKAWWYQGNQTGATCTSVAAGTTVVDLSSLTASTSYTYQAYSESGCASGADIVSVTFTTGASGDYDADNDGLIEITTLAQLNAMRWDLDGDGSASSGNTTAYGNAFSGAISNMGCQNNTCTGYELSANLDFDTGTAGDRTDDTYYNSGAGWTPIGSFATTFDGGGYKLSNLHINASGTTEDSTPDIGGLFGEIASGGAVSNLGLESVSVTVSSTLEDVIFAGAVAADNQGTITGVWSTGSVTGSTQRLTTSSWVSAGGLVGRNNSQGVIRASYSSATVTGKGTGQTLGTEGRPGGLVGSNLGTIAASFATGDVSATTSVTGQYLYQGNAGGLVGFNKGTITAAYASGAVSSLGTYINSGGLVGENKSGGTITATYSTGAATGDAQSGQASEEIGGLVGKGGGTTSLSYWDRNTSGNSGSAGGTGKTTSQLQTPAAYGTGNSIYANWNVNVDGVTGNDDPWDFGTSSQYPILKYGALNTVSQH